MNKETITCVQDKVILLITNKLYLGNFIPYTSAVVEVAQVYVQEGEELYIVTEGKRHASL